LSGDLALFVISKILDRKWSETLGGIFREFTLGTDDRIFVRVLAHAGCNVSPTWVVNNRAAAVHEINHPLDEKNAPNVCSWFFTAPSDPRVHLGFIFQQASV
jgi:hypothetical protein